MTMTVYRRIGVLLLLCVLGALASAAGRYNAAPRIIMLYGGVLNDQRIFMTDWHENNRFLASTAVEANVDADELAGRAVIQAALFWDGVRWEAYASDQKKLESLTPDLAEQHGWIYPGADGSEALFVLKSGPSARTRLTRRIGSDGLAILERYGIPASLD